MHRWQDDEIRLSVINTGYVLVYHPGCVNFCPGCARTHWHIGRHTVECAFCMTALPLAATARSAADTPIPSRWRTLLAADRWRSALAS